MRHARQTEQRTGSKEPEAWLFLLPSVCLLVGCCRRGTVYCYDSTVCGHLTACASQIAVQTRSLAFYHMSAAPEVDMPSPGPQACGQPRHSPFSFTSGSPFAKSTSSALPKWEPPSIATLSLEPQQAPPPQQQPEGTKSSPAAGDSATSCDSSSSSASSSSVEVVPADGMCLGAKVRTEFGDIGVVRFRGTTAFREGEWVGIELVRPKGKNAGVVQGVQYFTCAANHGLFSRPNKLTLLPADFNVDDACEPLPRSMSAVELSDGAAAAGVPSAPARGGNSEPPSARTSPGTSRAPRLGEMGRSSTSTVVRGSLEYALGYSPYPDRQVPPGWAHAWGVSINPLAAAAAAATTAAPGGGSGEGSASRDATQSAPGGPLGNDASLALPVVIYVSSLAGDRRQSKNCRWAMDFLVGKKVPHAIIDLSVHPQMRGQLVASLASAGLAGSTGSMAAATDSADSAAQEALLERRAAELALSTRRAEELLSQLPLIDLGGRRTISKGEMQDMEDHGELDPILRQAIRAFASKPSPALERALELAPQ